MAKLRPRAVLFDLNGTLSDDEEIFFEIFAELFAAAGRPLSRDEYFRDLVGLSDEEMVHAWLGDGYPGAESLLQERIRRFRELARDGSTIGEPARAAVRSAAARVPVGIVSGDYRDEIELLLDGAGLSSHVEFVVAIEDVDCPKPDPAQYLLALELLGNAIHVEAVVVFEDSPVGIEAAKAAGLYCVGVTGTLPAERLRLADEVVGPLDAAVVTGILGF